MFLNIGFLRLLLSTYISAYQRFFQRSMKILVVLKDSQIFLAYSSQLPSTRQHNFLHSEWISVCPNQFLHPISNAGCELGSLSENSFCRKTKGLGIHVIAISQLRLTINLATAAGMSNIWGIAIEHTQTELWLVVWSFDHLLDLIYHLMIPLGCIKQTWNVPRRIFGRFIGLFCPRIYGLLFTNAKTGDKR